MRHKQFTLGPLVMAALSGNVRPHIGHLQRFLCSCLLPHHVASHPSSFLVLRFISTSAECINRGEHLVEWHNKMGTRRSVKRHRELFIRGINLLFNICFVVGLCCVFKFTFLPVSSTCTQVLLIQDFTCLAEGSFKQLAAMEA